MAEDSTNQRTGFFGALKKRAAEALARQEASLARGKVAGTTVTDDADNVLVESGHIIDDDAIERAAAAGKLHVLAAAAITAQAQDLKEKARESYGRTQEGQEARALDLVEDFARARRYIGRFAGVDVTDIRGNVIVPAGKEIDEADVRAARDAGQLSALVYSAKQPIPESLRRPAHSPPEPPREPQAPVLPMATESVQQRRAPLPVLPLPKDDSGRE